MKTLNKFFAMLVLALAGLSLTACDDGDDLSTDQYGNEVALNSFGPCPVPRGGTLFFYGSNLDQVSEVDLPGADPITSIEVLQKGRESKISIMVPVEKCDTGKVVLKTIKGGTITSVTPVTYREDIEFEKFYVGDNESNLVGNVGDVVTIKGDYLNLMHGVIFQENDTVYEKDFIAHDRYTIKVAIPAEAKTGVIKVTDLAAEPSELESREAITINLPEVKGLTPETVKAGNTVTIKGTDFDQIVSVAFIGATVDAADFKTHSATEIAVALPEKATDGEVTLITKSGVEIPAGSITTVVPSALVAAPAPVKNGAEVTVTGKDLDLVTGISFPNADGADAKLTVTATKVTATVPETAQEGDITLSLANGKTVTVAYTLVKPTVTACTPAELTAGDKVAIKGTDLDLVKSITFPGDEPQTVETFTAQNASAIGLSVPAAAAGTGFTLNLKNGTTVEISGTLTVKAATAPAISSIDPSEACAGDQITIKGKNLQNVQSLYIGSYKVTRYASRTNTEIVCTVPATAEAGSYKVIIEDLDGAKTEAYDFKVVPAERDVAAVTSNMDGSAITYPYNLTWGDDGRFRIMKADLNAWGVKKGSKLIFYKEAGATGQVQINDANWGGIYTVADWSGTDAAVVQVFDDAMMAALTTSDGWSDTAFIIQGDLKSITKIAFLP